MTPDLINSPACGNLTKHWNRRKFLLIVSSNGIFDPSSSRGRRAVVLVPLSVAVTAKKKLERFRVVIKGRNALTGLGEGNFPKPDEASDGNGLLTIRDDDPRPPIRTIAKGQKDSTVRVIVKRTDTDKVVYDYGEPFEIGAAKKISVDGKMIL